MNDAHLTRERLYAYSDGLLPAAERRAAERHLAACVACRQQLTQSKQIVRALKAQRGQERASQALYATIRQQIGAQEAPAAGDSLSFSRGLALASALIVLVLVLTITYGIAQQSTNARRLLAQLAINHEQLAQDSRPLQMQGDAATLSAWLADAMHESIRVRAPEPWTLMGARMETMDGRATAHILYRQLTTGTMSLFIWRGPIATGALEQRQEDSGLYIIGTHDAETIVLWPDGDLNYACVGAAPPETVLVLAAQIRQADDKD